MQFDNRIGDVVRIHNPKTGGECRAVVTHVYKNGAMNVCPAGFAVGFHIGRLEVIENESAPVPLPPLSNPARDARRADGSEG